MKSVCAWCNREMFHDKLSGTTSMGQIIPKERQMGMSHGICKDCMEELQKQSGLQHPHSGAAAHESFSNWLERRQSSSGE